MSAERPTNVLIVGVGGQGVIMVSKVLAALAQRQGLQVKQSEVHGMAKRGGSVFSHVRFGPEVWSPVIPRGEADILVALEWAEGLRWLDALKRDGGTFIADTQQIVPPIAFRDRRPGGRSAYAPQAPAAILEMVGTGYALDATRIAAGLGNTRFANSVLLGALSTALPFAAEAWLAVLRQFVPPATVEPNLQAFRAGRDWVESGARPAEPAARPADAAPVATHAHRVEINASWCKGCNICVRMCPERCLRLDDNGIAALVRDGACTGCHLCEWLCPDFAIRVHDEAAPSPAR
ncbi:Pyruvate ferredoxin oxidoreductase [Rhodovastum atsumiense]|uniref:Pyruvate ferredoxin oxidoreductase n=1 Tax=Rhodovastum atsumiense TaxID=504468 RepID=A0A5M6IMU6_9PROT|nr:2-oxoacid:acceptor oxidoreductase family protein [Rhodovastum atsumiense]KAA5609189.1 pyruvate ferredoxin oxidoreductase [Rhodovastum atsumiense]CAH2602807.1 Pyruvate ferredoxin oxidoreductase [Rhodovastum atsumiense]